MSHHALFSPDADASIMKSGERCPKCGGTSSELYESVRGGNGPLAVGHMLAGAFAMFSQFEAVICQQCGYTEFYRKSA